MDELKDRRRPDSVGAPLRGKEWGNWHGTTIARTRPEAMPPADLHAVIRQLSAQLDRLETVNEQLRSQHADLKQQLGPDPVTGLPHRFIFEDRLDGLARRASRNQQMYALGLAKLDRLESINEAHGRAAGDEVLAKTARRLVDALRGSDSVCRVGGDEFGALMENVANAEAARMLAQRLATRATSRCSILPKGGGKIIDLTPKIHIGIVLHRGTGLNREELIGMARAAAAEAQKALRSVHVVDACGLLPVAPRWTGTAGERNIA